MPERIAAMSPEAVTEARVFSDRVYYFDRSRGERVEIENPIFVEVGKWKSEGAETTADDFLCTFYAALFTVGKNQIHWINTGEDSQRRLLVSAGKDRDGNILPYTESGAAIVAATINRSLAAQLELIENMRNTLSGSSEEAEEQ